MRHKCCCSGSSLCSSFSMKRSLCKGYALGFRYRLAATSAVQVELFVKLLPGQITMTMTISIIITINYYYNYFFSEFVTSN